MCPQQDCTFGLNRHDTRIQSMDPLARRGDQDTQNAVPYRTGLPRHTRSSMVYRRQANGKVLKHSKCCLANHMRHLAIAKSHNSSSNRESVCSSRGSQRRLDFSAPMDTEQWAGVLQRLTQRLMPELHRKDVTQAVQAVDFSQQHDEGKENSFVSHQGTVVIRGLPGIHRDSSHSDHTDDKLQKQASS